MFLISKIVRGRRLLHELEAQEAKDKEGGIDLPHLTKRHNQHRRSSPILFLDDDDVDLPYQEESSTAARRRMRREGAAARSQSCRIHATGGAAAAAAGRRSAAGKRVSSRLSSANSGNNSIEEEEEENRRRRRATVKTIRQKTEAASSFEAGESNESGSRASMRRTSSMPSVCDAKIAATTVNVVAPNVRHYDYDRKLNKMQKKALRFTWHRLQTRNGGKRVENVFEEVFDKMVRQLPCIRDMFTTRTFLCAMSKAEMASLRDHAKITVKMLDLIIRNLETEKSKRTDTGSNLDPRLVGRAHGPLRPYGLTGIFWEKLGETIIDVVLAQEAVRDLPGAGQAWVVLTACLVDQMRAGFDEARNTTFETKHKASTVLHHATMRLASVDMPEPPAYLTRQHSSSDDRSSHDQPPYCAASTSAPRGYSIDVSAALQSGKCPFSVQHSSVDDQFDDDEPHSSSPRSSSLHSSRRHTPPTPSSPCPSSPSALLPPLCSSSQSPTRSSTSASGNIIVHI